MFPRSVYQTSYPVDFLYTRYAFIFILSKQMGTFFWYGCKTSRFESIINCSIISGLKLALRVVNWLDYFKAFMWRSLMNRIFLLVNCLYAAGHVWYMLRHHLIISGCHFIPLLPFLLACSFCCCQSNHCGVSGLKVHSVEDIISSSPSWRSSLICSPSLDINLLIITDILATFTRASLLCFWTFSSHNISSSLFRNLKFVLDVSETLFASFTGSLFFSINNVLLLNNPYMSDIYYK